MSDNPEQQQQQQQHQQQQHQSQSQVPLLPLYQEEDIVIKEEEFVGLPDEYLIEYKRLEDQKKRDLEEIKKYEQIINDKHHLYDVDLQALIEEGQALERALRERKQ